jgi:hypothetical protein
MTPFVSAFADEIVKLSSTAPGNGHENLSDVVGAEALGPIASAVKGYQRRGLGGAARAAGGYILGGGAGALAGGLAAKGLHHVLGKDIGVGPVRASVALPSIGALILGLKAERLANR